MKKKTLRLTHLRVTSFVTRARVVKAGADPQLTVNCSLLFVQCVSNAGCEPEPSATCIPVTELQCIGTTIEDPGLLTISDALVNCQ